MRLTWHIIAKDLGRERWPLCVWFLVFVAQVGLGMIFLQVDPADLEWIDQLRMTGLLLVIFQFAIGILLALRWVQADAVSGTRMFWLTRPISGGRLLAAKGLGMFLVFGLMPLVLWLPWWMHCGLGGREIAWLAVETLGWQLLVIAPALLIGSLTDDLGRAIMWFLLLILAVAAWAFVGQGGLTAPDGRQISLIFTEIWASRLVVAGLFIGAGFAAIAAAQFVSRNSFRSMLRVMVLGLLVVLVGRIWITDISAGLGALIQPAAPRMIPDAGAGIVLSPKKARVGVYRYRQVTPAGPVDVQTLFVTMDVAGLPDDMSLSGTHPYQALLWDDAPTIRTTVRSGSSAWRVDTFLRKRLALPAVLPDSETVRWGKARLKVTNEKRAAKGLPALESYWDEPADDPAALRAVFPIPVSDVPRLKAEAPGYATHIEATLSRPEIMQQVSLESGARGTGAAPSLRVVGLKDKVVRLVETTPAFLKHGLFFSRLGRPLAREAIPNFDPSRTYVWAVNRHTGDVDSVYRRSLVPTLVVVGGIAINWTAAEVRPTQWIRNDQWVTKDPQWREHTSLVITTLRIIGHFSRGIRSGPLVMQFPRESPAQPAVPASVAISGEN